MGIKRQNVLYLRTLNDRITKYLNELAQARWGPESFPKRTFSASDAGVLFFGNYIMHASAAACGITLIFLQCANKDTHASACQLVLQRWSMSSRRVHLAWLISFQSTGAVCPVSLGHAHTEPQLLQTKKNTPPDPVSKHFLFGWSGIIKAVDWCAR